MSAQDVREFLVAHGRKAGAAVEPVRIRNATISGSLDLAHLRLEYDLDLTGCVFSGDLMLTGANTRSITLSGARMTSLVAEHLRVQGDLVMRGVHVIETASHTPPEPVPELKYGTGDQVQNPARRPDHEARSPIRLTSSRVDGDIILTGSTVHTADRWAVYAPRLQVGGSFIASGLRCTGGVLLSESRLENSIVLDGAHVGAVEANIVTARGGFLADWGFVASGPVHLLAMQVGNIVTFHDSELRGTPVAANLTRLSAARVRLDMRDRPGGRLVLRDLSTGALIDSNESWPAGGHLDLEGLKYGRIAATDDVTARQRIDWLTRDDNVGSSSFEQLAIHYQTSGDERAARTIRLARERHLVRRQKVIRRIWGWTQDALFGYGFVPSRALLWLTGLIGGGAWWFALHHVQPVKALEHPSWDPFLYALDLVVPIVDLGQEKAWDPVGVNKAVAMTLIIAGWLLATAVVAGARRLLSRP